MTGAYIRQYLPRHREMRTPILLTRRFEPVTPHRAQPGEPDGTAHP